MGRVAITATGSYTPGLVITNEELVERFGLDVDAAWIEDRTGIRERHWMEPGQTTSDMLVEAGRRVLEEAGCPPERVDRLIVGTVSPDLPSPSTATIVARKLGARCPAFDLSAACVSFLYGLDCAAGAIRGGEERVLVLCGDARSRFVDTSDRRSVVLFADAAAGALLEPVDPASVDGRGLLSVAIGAEGRERMGAWVPGGGAARPTSHETVDAGEHFLRVDGRNEIFELFLQFTREACELALARAGIGLDAVDLFINHQGNARLVERVVEDLGLPPERAVNEIARHGNTSGATVPLALDEARRSGRIRPGDTVLLSSVGAGWVFGAAVHRF